MCRPLLIAVLGFLFSVTPAYGKSRHYEAVVADPFIELHTGPGRGYPVFHVVDRGESVQIVKQRTSWYLVRTDRGIEGWVAVEFTISKLGTVKNPRVIGSHPSSIFDRAALKAIRKWKYNPKIEDGEPVERPGVKVKLTFDLSNQ